MRFQGLCSPPLRGGHTQLTEVIPKGDCKASVSGDAALQMQEELKTGIVAPVQILDDD